MKVYDFINCLAPSERGKRLVILSERYKICFDEPLSGMTLRHLAILKLDEKPIDIIKNGQTYIKILIKE